jgi:RimJ/RimL family protein N-acetyltransferase
VPLTTRLARRDDAPEMVEILNRIIQTGGTTAHEIAYTRQRMRADYIEARAGICCIVALRNGEIVGFQSLEWPYEGGDDFHADWGIIATFVKSGLTCGGIGAALFQATRMVAAHSGVTAIDATIRADNAGGLRYYAKMGFVDYARQRDARLRDGTPVDRVRKRFDL